MVVPPLPESLEDELAPPCPPLESAGSPHAATRLPVHPQMGVSWFLVYFYISLHPSSNKYTLKIILFENSQRDILILFVCFFAIFKYYLHKFVI